jgi:hypothetical protein
MRNKTLNWKYRAAMAAAVGGVLAAASIGLTGCGVTSASLTAAPVAATSLNLQGSVHGGQQPVSGSTLQLYATGSGGYGSAAYPLLTTTVQSNSTGGFSITGDYTGPSASSQVYLVATGGNPGSGTNSNLALMAALGSCSNLSASTYVSINELTTVAGVYALSPFMTGYANVGTSSANTQGLANAFGSASLLANTSTGAVPGAALPTGATVPTTELNTLADIIASCVNSTGGTSGDGSACGTLFADVTATGGTAPADTIGATLAIAKTPSNNVAKLIALAAPKSPFLPVLTSATDFTVSINYTSGFSTPSASSIDASGNVWVANAGNNTVSRLTANGAPVAGSPYSGGGLNTPSGIAIDPSGNAWVTDKGTSKLSVISAAGIPTLSTVVGLSSPTAIAIDGQGLLWITNGGSNYITEVTVSGTAPSSSTSYSGAGVSAPVAVAINPH